MRSRLHPAQTALVLSLLAGLAGAPASADWLVTQGGDRVETDGPWQVKGKLVVFTLPGGRLSSMRLADVDLDASDRLTAGVQKPVPIAQVEAVEETRAPVLVLTDDDVGHVDSRLTGSIGQRKQAGAEARARVRRTSAATDEGLSVVDWSHTFDDDIEGIVITGRLQNRTADSHADITMQIILSSTSGVVVGRAAATIEDTVLDRRRSTHFRATFPGIVGFDRPEFQISSAPLVPQEEPTAEEDETVASTEDSEDQ